MISLTASMSGYRHKSQNGLKILKNRCNKQMAAEPRKTRENVSLSPEKTLSPVVRENVLLCKKGGWQRTRG